MRPIPVLPSLAIALVFACGGDGDGSGGPPPTGALTIESVRPTDGTTQADPLSPVVVSFGAALDPATVTDGAFPLTRDGDALPASATYDAATRSVVLTAPLVPGASYDAAVETTVAGDGGERLEQRFEWSFVTRSWETTPLEPASGSHGLAMAADPDGRLHLLFWTPVAGGAGALRYATCATQCLTLANWTAVTLAQANSGGPLAILADGGPLHIAYQNGSTARLFYATCSGGCTVAAAWQSVELNLAAAEGYDAITLGRDGSGRLHLATVGTDGGPHYGVVYANCAAGCTTATNWQGAPLAPDGNSPSLIAEPTGRLHMVYRDPAGNTLRYGTCAGGCETAGNWTDVPVDLDASTSTGTALAMDGTGGLHAVYLGGTGGVYYATCAGQCEQSVAWHSTAIADAGDLRVQVGLALGETGRVHVIFGRRTQLEYATCVRDCAVRANWQLAVGLPAADTRHLGFVRDPAGGLHLAAENLLTGAVAYAE